MRKWIVTALVGVMLTSSGAALANSGKGSPGPNGHNTGGLCNAYSEGSATGQANKQAHGQASMGLVAAAAAADAKADGANNAEDSQATDTNSEMVADYCAANG